MMIRMRGGVLAAWLFVTSIATIGAVAQADGAQAPEAPSPQAGAPAQPAGQLQPMPPPDPANFTATSPTKETVEAFLKASWGYDENRIYQVQAIEKTQVQGISRVTVLVEEKGGQQTQPAPLTFLTLPDGKHLIANDEILPFGARPFANYHSILLQG